MSLELQLADLRKWLKEDEMRLQSVAPTPAEKPRNGVTTEFNDFGSKPWGDGPGGWPFTQWNQWGNGS